MTVWLGLAGSSCKDHLISLSGIVEILFLSRAKPTYISLNTLGIYSVSSLTAVFIRCAYRRIWNSKSVQSIGTKEEKQQGACVRVCTCVY